MYAPSLGRFLQPDPIGYGDGMNMYAYVEGDPVNASDPTGLASCGGSGMGQSTGSADVTVVVCFTNGGAYDGGGGPDGIPSAGGDDHDSRDTTYVTVHGIKKKTSHQYTFSVFDYGCSADDVFTMWKASGASAPGAPHAKEGFTPRINLLGLGKVNPISQTVDSKSRTIVNNTLVGHDFYPGTVTITVKDLGPLGAMTTVVGVGDGANPLINDAVGYAFFGGVATTIANGCGDHKSNQWGT